MISIRFPAFVQQTYLATSLVITLSRFSQKFHVGQTIRSIFAESAYLFILHHVFGEASVSSDGVCNKCDFDCYKCVSSSNVLSAIALSAHKCCYPGPRKFNIDAVTKLREASNSMRSA